MDPFQPMHSGYGIQLSFQKQIVNKKCIKSLKHENCAPSFFTILWSPFKKF
jgi:hypothetical protein